MSTPGSTKRRILTATLELLEERPGGVVAMGDIAKRARVSRQALYLHFADRTALILEASRQVDGDNRTPDRQRLVDGAPNAREALREAVRLQGYLKPRLHSVTTALAAIRRIDPDVEAAWQEREHARLDRCRDVAQRLAAEGALRDGETVARAAASLWALTAPGVWEDLTMNLGWSTEEYVDWVIAMLERGVLTSQA